MEKRWKILQVDEDRISSLQNVLKINKAICKILVQRDITTFNKSKSFFRPQLSDLHSPWLMKNMNSAVERINSAIYQNEKILLFGDYDVDGTTAVASFFQFLRNIYQNTGYYIPHRYKEGYGISKMGIDFAFQNGYSLIISLDCGIKSAELIAYAKTLSIDFIVCDHHLPDKEIPSAVAVLNPKQEDCDYPFKELCGCGVGFKLMQALSEVLNLPALSYLQYLDLVATAIAADIVPITGENRILAFYGLKKVNEEPCVGIKALLQLAAMQKIIHINNLVFVIAPRINAAGRMDDARKAVQLFIEQDYEKALEFAEMLHNDNSDRKETDSTITDEALLLIQNDKTSFGRKTTVVYREHWHKGVVGIVASRLIENYYRPTVVLTKSGDIISGSARSVPGFNLYEAIHACKEYLLGYGGHSAAAGVSLLEQNLSKFIDKFEETVAATIPPDLLIPEIIIDAEIKFKDITPGFYNILQQMEPFGPGNMRPLFISYNVHETGYSRIVKENHIRFVLKQDDITFTAIGFNLAPKFLFLQMNNPVDIVYSIDMNEWNGESNLQLKIIDFALSENFSLKNQEMIN